MKTVIKNIYEASLFLVPEHGFSSAIEAIQNSYDLEFPKPPRSGPHVTVFTLCFKEDALSKFTEHVRSIDFEPAIIKVGDVVEQPSESSENVYSSPYFYLPITVTDEVFKLHEKLTTSGLGFWDRTFRFNDQKRFNLGTYSKDHELHVRKYGFLRSMDKFKPHITLGAIKNRTDKTCEEIANKLSSYINTDIKCSVVYQIKTVNSETGEVISRKKHILSKF